LSLIAKRFQASSFEALAAMNRFQGSGGGNGMLPLASQGEFAGGALGAYATANSSTWTDITGTSFTIAINRPTLFIYLVFATCRITVGAGQGYVRGSIVGFDNTASPFFAGTLASNGFIWYFPVSKGPIPAGNYTVKLQAATDAGSTITVDQAFHQFFVLAA
jgi:hypothetical protein